MAPRPDAQDATPITTKQKKLQIVELNENRVKVDDCVYETSAIASIHPGGELFVKAFSGRDATEAFLSYHRRKFPHEKMTHAFIGNSKREKVEDADDDYHELCKRVDAVLPRHKAFAPTSYYVKVFGIIAISLGLEGYMHYNRFYAWYLTGTLGFFFALIGLNIQHDANHGAISRNSVVNRLLGLTQNWLGGSALDWIHQHVVQHHINPNDVEQDPDIVGNELLRFNPLKPLESIQAFQHIYLFLLLGLFGISYIANSVLHNVTRFHLTPVSRLLKTNHYFELATIGFFCARWLALPLILAPGWSTVLNVIPLFIVGGYYLSFFFVISHNFEGVQLFEKEYGQKVDPSFLRRQVATAANVCGAKLAFLNGGLNYQIEHHLFPRISHAHYPTIAPVVRQFCEERGVPYVHYDTIWENTMATVRHMRKMGHGETPEGFKTALSAPPVDPTKITSAAKKRASKKSE